MVLAHGFGVVVRRVVVAAVITGRVAETVLTVLRRVVVETVLDPVGAVVIAGHIGGTTEH